MNVQGSACEEVESEAPDYAIHVDQRGISLKSPTLV
jgi:hypothetical protein